MKRGLTANLGWIFIIGGIILILISGITAYSLISVFLGFFLRLIYNSEKYKYFKFLNSELLQTCGKSDFQQKALSSCLFGFYRGLIDLLGVILLPFFIIPILNLPWYCNWLIGILYIFALKPIFAKLNETDRVQVKQIVTWYEQES